MTYEVKERCETDDEIRRKAMNNLEFAELVLKRDIEVITHAYYKRVSDYKAKKGVDGLFSDDVVLTQSEEIFKNSEWLASVDEFCAMVNKKNVPDVRLLEKDNVLVDQGGEVQEVVTLDNIDVGVD
ncbi:uncharacterized protein LOC130825345 [Amaranthus tricolor]|uniref:uncharacterized protein LOC130825345 n=1 Tax=Amaranthus tricolor TaxID=29722 RepID=UPI00258A0E96|nr:uncharacterized protein LOC130825345 [Amaranthus tricolor]